MGGFKVAIVGAGKMGALLAGRIPAVYRKVIISRDRAGAAQVADEVGGLASDQISAVRGCQVVFLAVPGSAVPQLVRDMSPHVAEGALVVNMAPDLSTDDLAAEFPGFRVAAAKVLGHAREMGLGARGVVMLDHLDDDAEEQLRVLLDGLGSVVRGSEATVQAANAAIAEVMQDAQSQLIARLTDLGLERRLAQAVLAAAAPGVLHALSAGEPNLPVPGAIDKLKTGAHPSH